MIFLTFVKFIAARFASISIAGARVGFGFIFGAVWAAIVRNTIKVKKTMKVFFYFFVVFFFYMIMFYFIAITVFAIESPENNEVTPNDFMQSIINLMSDVVKNSPSKELICYIKKNFQLYGTNSKFYFTTKNFFVKNTCGKDFNIINFDIKIGITFNKIVDDYLITIIQNRIDPNGKLYLPNVYSRMLKQISYNKLTTIINESVINKQFNYELTKRVGYIFDSSFNKFFFDIDKDKNFIGLFNEVNKIYKKQVSSFMPIWLDCSLKVQLDDFIFIKTKEKISELVLHSVTNYIKNEFQQKNLNNKISIDFFDFFKNLNYYRNYIFFSAKQEEQYLQVIKDNYTIFIIETFKSMLPSTIDKFDYPIVTNDIKEICTELIQEKISKKNFEFIFNKKKFSHIFKFKFYSTIPSISTKENLTLVKKTIDLCTMYKKIKLAEQTSFIPILSTENILLIKKVFESVKKNLYF